jgi:hypothetical protein
MPSRLGSNPSFPRNITTTNETKLKKVLVILMSGLTALALMGASKCQPPASSGSSTHTYTWQVLAAPNSCTCKDSDKKTWNLSTTLLVVNWGWFKGDGTTDIQTEHGESTPWEKNGAKPARAINISLDAQAADHNVKLLCLVYEDGLLLGAYGAPAGKPGTCSALSDL